MTLQKLSCDVVTCRQWCKQYCDEHWHDENLIWNVPSVIDLFLMLRRSPYFCPFNPGLLKHIADKSESIYLINTVKNYEEKFSHVELKDLPFVNKLVLVGNNISAKESHLISDTLLESQITIGELWDLCSPRFVYHAGRPSVVGDLILNASKLLLKFYYSIKVRSYICLGYDSCIVSKH